MKLLVNALVMSFGLIQSASAAHFPAYVGSRLSSMPKKVYVTDQSGTEKEYSLSKKINSAIILEGKDMTLHTAGASDQCNVYLGQLATDLSVGLTDSTVTFVSADANKSVSVYGCPDNGNKLTQIRVKNDSGEMAQADDAFGPSKD